MIAAATPAAARPDAPPELTPEETGKLVVTRLAQIVLYGKPRRAIAAFRSLTQLCVFYHETHTRIVELSRTSRPAVAAAAVTALVQERLALQRYRDGRSRLLGP
jgi:hypothetical protein